MLVVVDDAQWLDASSADALLFAARRLRGEGVAMLVATRPGRVFDAERAGLPRVTLQDSMCAPHAPCSMRLTGRCRQLARLLADRSEGNPLALLEVPLVLSEAQLAGRGADRGAAACRPDAGARAASPALGPADPRHAAGSWPPPAAGSACSRSSMRSARSGSIEASLDAAEQAGVLSIAGERFEFRHPLLRSAIYHGASGLGATGGSRRACAGSRAASRGRGTSHRRR